MKKLLAVKIFLAVLLLPACQTDFGKAVQKWEITHQPQIEQTAFLLAKDVAMAAAKAFMGGYQDGKFSFAAGLRSLEGNYTSPSQIAEIANTWSPNTAGVNQVAAILAADLANNPPTTKDQVVARLEGYVAGIAPAMGVPTAQQPKSPG